MRKLKEFRVGYAAWIYKACLVGAIYIAWFVAGGYPDGGSCTLEVKFESK